MKSILLTVLFMVGCHSAVGQNEMSFKDCLNLAIKNNLSIKESDINEEIAVYGHKRSKGELLPSINAYADGRYSWGRDIDPRTNTFVNQTVQSSIGDITSNLTLFSGFLNLNQIKFAKQTVELNKANIQKIKNDITIDLAHKYIVLSYLQETIAANKEQIESSEKQLEIAQLKLKSGVIAESEVFKIQSQKAAEELTLTSNQNEYALFLIDLKQIMNIPLETDIKLISPIMVTFSDQNLNENQYSITKKAVAIHPSFLMSQLNEKLAKTDISISRAALFPTINLRYRYGSNYSDSDVYNSFNEQLKLNAASSLRLSIDIPIFNQLETTYRIKQSKLAYQRSKIMKQSEENRLSKVVLQAINDAKTANQKQETANAAFEFAKKSYETDLLKFEAGKININELNFTKINYIKAQADLIRAKYEYVFNKSLVNFYLGEEFSF